MPDLHITATLVANAAGPAANPAAGDTGSPQGDANSFSSLLAGQVAGDPKAAGAGQPPGAPMTLTLTEGQPAIGAEALATVAHDPAGEHPAAAKDEAPADGKPEADATAQMLMAIGILPPAVQPRAATAPVTAQPGTATASVRAGGSSAPKSPFQPAPQARDAAPAALQSTTLAAAPQGKTAEFSALLSADMRPVQEHTRELPSLPALQQPASQPAPSGPAAPARLTVPGPVGTPLWREEFAAGVSMLANQKVSSAELHVQPAELGPVQVSIRIEGGEANIACTAQHPETRHALDAAMPRLREMLEANGISVGGTSVGPQTFAQGGQGGSDPQPGSRTPTFAPTAGAAEAVSAPPIRPLAHANQLVDTFA